MASIVKVTGVNKLLVKLAKKAALNPPGLSAVVGYTQEYAIYVHENEEAHHNVGQAKFLEQPARTHSKELTAIIATSISKGFGMAQGLMLAGLRLQRESQKLVPVDTGALKNSAFTHLETFHF